MYNITQFSKLINYSVKTLQRWDRENILKPENRTKTNRRLYSHNQLLEFIKSPLKSRKNIIYCRVSKLLSFFISTWNPTRIVSYADKDWSCGDLYLKLGFDLISESRPDYKYLVNGVRVHKSNFKKSKLRH